MVTFNPTTSSHELMMIQLCMRYQLVVVMILYTFPLVPRVEKLE